MAGSPFPELEYLRQRAVAQCAGLSDRLDELVSDFPGGTPKDFIAALQSVLDELRRVVDGVTDLGVLSWACLLVEQDLSEYLRCLDNAHTAQTPRALVKVLENAAARLSLPRDTRLLVAPDYECNYSIDDQIPRLHNLLVSFLPKSAMKRIFRALPSALYLVQFPRIDRDHVLSYAIFGHELGHPLVQKVLDHYETTREYKRQIKDVQAELLKASRRRGTVGRYARQQAERDFKSASKIARRGFEELLSDSVGALIFGPSALFAAIDHFFATGLDNAPDPDEYYPPTRYRHRRMLELLRREGHIDAVKTIAKKSSVQSVNDHIHSALVYIDGLAAKRDDTRNLQVDDATATAYKWIDQALPSLVRLVRNECRSFLYSADLAIDEVPELLNRLALGLPPSEIDTWPTIAPCDWRSSLLAGWLTRLTTVYSDDPTSPADMARVDQINRLTTKGIEDAVLAHEYRASRETST